MARTRLFSSIARAMRLAARSQATGKPTSEVLERAAEARWDRRQFLAASALATAGAAATAAGPGAAFGAASPRVVIVGAGSAGLTCAYRLQQAGVRARVLEAGSRVGGRMLTLRGAFPEGQAAELGGEFVDTGHRSLRRLARELGLTLVDLEADSAEGDTYFFEGRHVPLEEVVEEFRPVAGRILEDLATIGGDGFVTHDNPNNGQELDRTSLAEWLDTRVGGGAMRALLEVAYVGEYGLDAGEQSALNLLFLIGARAGAFEVFGDSDERFRIAEGSDSVPARLAGRLKRPVETDTRLEAIRRSAAGAYVLTVERDGAVSDVTADAVVLAIPFTLLRQVDVGVELPPAKRLAIDTLGYGTNAKVLAGFSSRVWRASGSTGSTFTDLAYQSSWEATRGAAGEHGVMTNYLGGRAGVEVAGRAPRERATEFAAQLDLIFPGTAGAFTGQASVAHWASAPHALGSYSCYRPGQYSTIAGAEKTRVRGLHFAGEHTSLNFQGYMNGATSSGERAAAEVLARVRR